MPTTKRFLLTGATGFIGSEVLCKLLESVEPAQIFLLVRKVPDSAKSLLAQRLKDSGHFDSFSKLNFVVADFLNEVEFVKGLQNLPKGELHWLVIHMAAIISGDGQEENQERVNVGVTKDLVNWSNENAARFLFTSSVAAFGGLAKPQIRTETDFSSFPAYCTNISYFWTKRQAHEFLLQNIRISGAVFCPGIVHGKLDHFKGSRGHLALLRAKRLRVAPAGGGNFVGLDRVGSAIAIEALRNDLHKSGALSTRLVIDKNLSYQDYFQIYSDLWHGSESPRIYVLPKIVGRGLISGSGLISTRNKVGRALDKVLQSSLYLYFVSQYKQEPTQGIEQAIADSQQGLR